MEMKAPVLLILFNRPKQTETILRALSGETDRKFYVSIDGPRPGRASDLSSQQQLRELIANYLGACEVHVRQLVVNQGSHRHIPEAVDWLFEQEERGIVLEDDCVPGADFVRFCDEALEAYDEDERVMWVNGFNCGWSAQGTKRSEPMITRFAICWGWASWRRAWSRFAFRDTGFARSCDMAPVALRTRDLCSGSVFFWRQVFAYASRIPNWDFRWLASMWQFDGVAISPSVNLISNIGIGMDAVHGGRADDPRYYLSTEPISWPLHWPRDGFEENDDFDVYLCHHLYRVGPVVSMKYMLAAKFPALRAMWRVLRRKFAR